MNAAELLKKYFGYDSFREGQQDVIDAILSGQDALAVMPTGAGKSICYQVPALLLPGITLVISPLISLMQDQVKSLNEAGIHAAFINSSLTETQIAKALTLAARGAYKIIYVAPERLESADFLEFAVQSSISMVTVDEAHCISQWGQDFRPGYLKIVDFIDRLPVRPIVSAFTATATKEVRRDIEAVLKLDHPKAVTTGFDRENLYYRVEYASGKEKDRFVIDYISSHPGKSGIVYCATRKNVDELYEKLRELPVSVTCYHAGIDNRTRKSSQEDFIYDRAQVIVATNAFGMGIDKSNVRYVIHYNMPQSMENYYQEAGRAGRDGENAQCILLFAVQDIIINRFLMEKKIFEGMDEEGIRQMRQRDARRLQVMEEYCRITSCLRNYILSYFGEETDGPCENCGNCHQEYEEVDMTADARWVINCIAEMKGRYGQSLVVGTLRGAKRARLLEIGANAYRSYGVLEQRSEEDLRLLISQMLTEGYIYESNGDYKVLKMGDISGLRDENTHVIIRKVEDREGRRDRERKRSRSDAFTGTGFRLFERLRQLRFAIAAEESVPPDIIFSDRTLKELCVRLPKDPQELLSVSGVGEYKAQKYGRRFLDEIAAFLLENPLAVTSMEKGDGRKTSGKGRKGAFYLNPDDAENYPYSEYCYISEIKDRLNSICSAEFVKKASITGIWDYLVKSGLTMEEERDGSLYKVRTEEGQRLGIRTVDKISQNGTEYQLLMYPESVQKMIVEYFVGLGEKSEEERDAAAVPEAQSNRGLAWTEEEDERLINEFHSGMSMSEMSAAHKRTRGAIRARLVKHGLMEQGAR